MMNLGIWEIVAIAGIALLFFGPSRLPGLGRSVGEAIRGFKKGMEGLDENPDASSKQQASQAYRAKAENNRSEAFRNEAPESSDSLSFESKTKETVKPDRGQ